MINSIRGLLFHLLIIVMTFCFAMFLNYNEIVRDVVYSSVVFRGIICIFIVSLYYNFGKGMTKKYTSKLDFFTGNFIVIISLIFLIPAVIMLRMDLFNVIPGKNMWRLPLDLFLMPEFYIVELLNVGLNIFSLAASMLMPGLIYGLSIKKSRVKIKRRNRIKNNRMKSN